ncbi:MAG TPA: hypothetical protein VJQ54_21620 [Candidatus Sulfotelmatobacter sp.]|nr:hypothetical protein [Candidatus Sulfotelmatobacter sp.]
MRNISTRLLLVAAFVLTMLVAACSINVKKDKTGGQDKDVDIRTPLGGIHVSKGANADDVGVPVYPGAHLKQENSDGSDKSANVNISGFGFGLRVVALEYESNDSPEKVVSYYKDQLKKYGNVLVCHTTHFHVDAAKHGDDGSHELTCEGSNGNNIELKVGTKENQHIVAVEPQGSGSSFSLVYLRTHGKDADI